MTSRFDYVKYDEESIKKQAQLKIAAQKVETAIEVVEAARQELWDLANELFPELPPWVDHALNKLNEATGPDVDEALYDLEVCYMGFGKAIRDEQIERNGGAELQEGRTDS